MVAARGRVASVAFGCRILRGPGEGCVFCLCLTLFQRRAPARQVLSLSQVFIVSPRGHVSMFWVAFASRCHPEPRRAPARRVSRDLSSCGIIALPAPACFFANEAKPPGQFSLLQSAKISVHPRPPVTSTSTAPASSPRHPPAESPSPRTPPRISRRSAAQTRWR